jgi:cell division protein FtsW
MPFAWDTVTLGLVAALLLIGLIMVTSASMSIAARDSAIRSSISSASSPIRLVGMRVAWLVTRVPTELWDKYSLPLLLFGFCCCAGEDSGPGRDGQRRARWLRIGPVNFQVSELATVLVLTWVCSYCVRKRGELERRSAGSSNPWACSAWPACCCCSSRISARHGAVRDRFRGAVRRRRAAALRELAHGRGDTGVRPAGAAVAVPPEAPDGLSDPWDDPFNGGFQLTQSLIAIGRGAWFGVGLGSSVQKLFYLPEAHTISCSRCSPRNWAGRRARRDRAVRRAGVARAFDLAHGGRRRACAFSRISRSRSASGSGCRRP